MTRRLESVKFRDDTTVKDSLVLSLDAILRAYGAEVDLPALSAVIYSSKKPDWRSIRSLEDLRGGEAEVRVVEAARQWGLELRDLHPPDAAPLPTPPEFEQHFNDSYMPFIRAAIDRDEPVLTWMGWPPPDESEWGVITGIDAKTGRCVGRTVSCSHRDVMLQGPSVQVYTIVR